MLNYKKNSPPGRGAFTLKKKIEFDILLKKATRTLFGIDSHYIKKGMGIDIRHGVLE